MIPQDYITAWSRVAPWASRRQVEQDLIISRALVAIFSDPFLRGELRFRGGSLSDLSVRSEGKSDLRQILGKFAANNGII